MSVAIQWFENAAFDAPELKSPQPCIHGAGCVYTKKTADGKVVPGVCAFVHPGEEGRGRRLFPARTFFCFCRLFSQKCPFRPMNISNRHFMTKNLNPVKTNH